MDAQDGGSDAVRRADRPADVVVLDASEGSGRKARACFSDGSPLELGTTPTASVALSPDGQHLALHLGEARIDIVSTADASAHHLPGTGPEFNLEGLRWTPDGTRLAYLAGGVPNIADGDGTNSLPIEVSLPEQSAGYLPSYAEWSADLAHVAFVTRGVAVLADAQTGQGQIVSHPVDQGGPRSVVRSGSRRA